jgi:TrmH family RNA methyltransferase
MSIITSLQNDRVKRVHALQTRSKARRKEGQIVLEGARLVHDAIQRDQLPYFVLYDPDSIDLALIETLRARNISPLPISTEVMHHISDTEHPQGIVAVFPLPQSSLPEKPSRLLILDTVRDPGNLGTILRTAAAAGTQAVLLAPGCADPYNPKVLRGGMGAHFRIPIVSSEWEQIADTCAGLTVYLADSTGDQRYDLVDWLPPWALIIGGEAQGAGTAAQQLATTRIAIPMAAATESLNAAVAAGIILFHATHRG